MLKVFEKFNVITLLKRVQKYREDNKNNTFSELLSSALSSYFLEFQPNLRCLKTTNSFCYILFTFEIMRQKLSQLLFAQICVPVARWTWKPAIDCL